MDQAALYRSALGRPRCPPGPVEVACRGSDRGISTRPSASSGLGVGTRTCWGAHSGQRGDDPTGQEPDRAHRWASATRSWPDSAPLKINAATSALRRDGVIRPRCVSNQRSAWTRMRQVTPRSRATSAACFRAQAHASSTFYDAVELGGGATHVTSWVGDAPRRKSD